MYRLLTIKKPNIENAKLALCSQKHSISCNRKCNYATPLLLELPANNPNISLQMEKGLHSQLVLFSKPTHIKSFPTLMKTIRFQSTTPTTETLEKTKKKSRKPRYAKYVELLEVTDTAANVRKNRVKHLKSKKLQDFIYKAEQEIIQKIHNKRLKSQQLLEGTSATCNKNIQQPVEYQKIDPNLLDTAYMGSLHYDDKPFIFLGKDFHYSKCIVNNPERMDKILQSYYNYKDFIESIQNNEHIENSNFSTTITPNHNVEEEETLDPLYSSDPYMSPDIMEKKLTRDKATVEILKKQKSSFKSKAFQSEEFELMSKQRALKVNLSCYLNVCVSAGLLNRGLSTLLAYRQKGRKNTAFKNLLTIDLYNILLHGYAEKGAFEKFIHLFNLMEEDHIKFNEQTFAAIFECLGRLESSDDNKHEIQKYIEKMESLGFNLHDIMNNSKFSTDQRDIALDAIRRIVPDFTPIYTPPVLNYNNILLNHLNGEQIEALDKNSTSQNLSGTGGIWDSKRGYNKEQLQRISKEQLEIELNGYITIKSIEKSKIYDNADYFREKLKDLETVWRSQISGALVREMNTLKAQMRYKPQGHMTYYTYLKALDKDHYIDILIKEIYKLAEGSETYSPTVGQLYKEMGQKVQWRYQIELKKRNGMLEKIGDLYSSYCDVWHESQSNHSYNPRQIWQRLVHQERCNGPSMDVQDISWPTNVLIGVGRFLYNILMRDIKIDAYVMRQNPKSKNILPAFYTLFRNQGRVVKEEVKPHPVLARLLRASSQQQLTFESNLVPMLCPPQPWSSPFNGGYLLNKTDLIRLPHQAIQQWERIKAMPVQNIYPALDSLNQLASVPWRVNTDVLDVLIEVFQNGGDNKLDVPQRPSTLPPLPSLPEKNTSKNNAERAKLLKEKMMYRRKQAEMYSLWCDTLYRLSLANHYRDKVFWLAHNMDFRGRVYPVPPHLNHLGSDLARSMLIFDQPQPLGNDGFKWLKLHCINLTGLKKRDSIRERLYYADEVMPEILDSADNPLTGRMWWRTSEEPWQTLACCMEIAKIYRSSNPALYESRFPIHQDGSCNGLQHYAALGRDTAGAFNVNLTPSPLPQDVYSAVAALVEKTRKYDAENGLHVAQALDGYVRRKVIKQTVMTTVYGVTRYGARLQISRQLKDIDDFPKDWVWPASTYLTAKTFESLREMFTSTREIQDWFTECARLISGVCNKNVEWVTPLGLPIVQPYNRQDHKFKYKNNAHTYENMSSDIYEKPNIMKQKNAFPPNFIHSLDSSHMMLTSLHCERQGLTFVSVHDCFWTHACTVPLLNHICRQQFVALHSQPILKDLSQFLKAMYSFKESELTHGDSAEDLSKDRLNRLLGQLPPTGDFNLEQVLNSDYFFC